MPDPRAGAGHSEEDDPPLVVGRPRDGDAEHLLAAHRDDRVVLLARGEHLGERVDGLDALLAHLVPEAQDRIHVGGLVVAKAHSGHAPWSQVHLTNGGRPPGILPPDGAPLRMAE